jgi:hypothetical protein
VPDVRVRARTRFELQCSIFLQIRSLTRVERRSYAQAAALRTA